MLTFIKTDRPCCKQVVCIWQVPRWRTNTDVVVRKKQTVDKESNYVLRNRHIFELFSSLVPYQLNVINNYTSSDENKYFYHYSPK